MENTAIFAKNLHVVFDHEEVLSGITFAVPEGQIAAIIGPNASGKTTLIRAILGLAPLAEGEVVIFGRSIEDGRKDIGYVPQRFSFDHELPITVGEFLGLALGPGKPKTRISAALREVGLPEEADGKRLGHLSGGQLQRTLIARALLNEPRLLILDEPAAGIDIAGAKTFRELILNLKSEHKTTILLVSHEVGMVTEIAEQILCVKHSLLCSGAPRHTLTEETMRRLYGKEDEIAHHH